MHSWIRKTALIAGVALASASVSVSAKTLTIGTNPQGSVAYAIGAAIGSAASDRGMQTRVVPQGGPVVIMPMVNRGSFDLTVSPSIPMTYAHRGQIMFDGKPLDDLRVAAVLFPLRVGFVVRADSDIKSIADLRGKRMASSFPRQQSLLMMQRASLATAGLDLEDVEEVPVPDGTRGLDELAAGNVDTVAFSVGSGRVAQTDASVSGGIRFLPLPEGDEAERAMQAITPSAYFEAAQPAPGRPGVLAPTNMLTSSMLLITNSHVSDEQVRELLEIIVEKADDIAATHGVFRAFDPNKMYRDFGVPYHPAALEFYRERGLLK